MALTNKNTPAQVKRPRKPASPVDLAPPVGGVDLAPATQPDAAGALAEPAILQGVDTKHPAVDDNPRAGLPPESNQIDFNDPTLPGGEAVRRNLDAQSKG